MVTTIFDRPLNRVILFLLALQIAATLGCDSKNMRGSRLLPSLDRTFHQKFNWRAADFFDDPKVIALCEAIEANDLQHMEEVIASGANVNARGVGNMTPLMWAFPDDKLERFQLLLKQGADPNVKITSNLGVPSRFAVGDSVTTEAAHFAHKTNTLYFDNKSSCLSGRAADLYSRGCSAAKPAEPGRE